MLHISILMHNFYYCMSLQRQPIYCFISSKKIIEMPTTAHAAVKRRQSTDCAQHARDTCMHRVFCELLQFFTIKQQLTSTNTS